MRTILLLLAFVTSVSAQNFAVSWTGNNTNGIPFYWPIILHPVGTNTAWPGAVVLTAGQIGNVIQTNQAAFRAAKDTDAALLKLKAEQFIANLQADMDAAAVSVGLLQGSTLTNPQKVTELQTLKVTLGNVRTRVNKLVTVSTQLLDQVIDQ